jgi:transposase-like protein
MPTLSKLTKDAFHNEMAAFEYLEATLWPNGAICPHCGTIDQATRLQTNGGSKDGKRQARLGLWKCNEKECRKQFTVKIGSVFEHGRIPLHKMLQAVYLLCCSKKGCSSHQLHRVLGITYKAAWFLSHRIREAMKDGALDPIGGGGKIVEADETFIGRKKGFPKRSGAGHKMVVMSLVERDGPVRSTVLDLVSRPDVEQIIRKNVRRDSRLMTDAAAYYRRGELGPDHHEMVDHSAGEYVRGDAHANTLEGYFSVFKRGMKGVYQHCGEKHLHRYVAEFDFRYNNRVRLGVGDEARTTRALRGVVGKRLTYRRANSASGQAAS